MKNTEDEKDIIALLANVERIEKLTDKKAKEEYLHIAKQFKIRYKYLVGEWSNGKHAKSTLNGQIVSSNEVKNYLDNIS